jgi:hypothetical protein
MLLLLLLLTEALRWENALAEYRMENEDKKQIQKAVAIKEILQLLCLLFLRRNFFW